VEDASVLVNGPTQPVPLPADGDHNLVQVPNVMAIWYHAAAGVIRLKLCSSVADDLLREGSASVEQHLLVEL
jgi:hypothetical protein